MHKDVALTDIVDSLVNAKFFKPDLEQDYDRIVPNQLVFAVIGWLRELQFSTEFTVWTRLRGCSLYL